MDVRDKQSAAAKAGLQAGDIILEFGGETISSAQNLIQKVASTAPEQTTNIVFLREVGSRLERKTTTIKLAERPTKNVSTDDGTRKKLPVEGQKKAGEPFGLTVTEVTAQLAAVYKLGDEKGVLIKNINPASFIADVKNSNGTDAVGEGDLIQRVNRLSVTDLKSFNEAAAKLKTGDAVVLHVLSYNRVSRNLQPRIVQFTVQ